jgi:hypothetical protein
MFVPSKKLLDLHFVQFKYKKGYRKQVLSSDEDFLNVIEQRQLAVESLYPSLIEGLNLRDGDRPSQSQRVNTLRPSKIGVVRLPFAKVTSIVQIGDDIRFEKPVHIIVTGQLPNEQGLSSTLLCVEDSGVVKVITTKMPISGKIGGETIEKMLCDQSDEKAGREARLLVQTTEGNIHILKAKAEGKQLVLEKDNAHPLAQGEGLHSISNGVACILTKDNKTRTFAISADFFERISQRAYQPKPQPPQSSESENPQSMPEEEVLKLSIDPKEVTIGGLDQYENLMRGKVANSCSNANYQVGPVGSDSHSSLRSIHTWRNDSSQPQAELGPFEVKFEKPTSLVSLNLDLAFECQSTEKLVQSLKPDGASAQALAEEVKVAPEEEAKEEATAEVKTEDIKLIVTDKAPPKPQALGIFSIKGFADAEPEKADAQEAQAATDSNKYLPLVVKRNKGASYNNQYIASRLLADNDRMFASNYPKPELTFAHMNGE